jgi:O-antigen ligase
VSRRHGASVAEALLAAALVLLLVHGGFYASAQAAAGVLAVTAVLAMRPAVNLRDPVLLSLVALAAANMAAALDAGTRSVVAPTLAVCSLPAAYAAARALGRRQSVRLLAVILGLAVAAAAAGLAAVITQAAPDAQRIEGMWRAGGPLEYPPALAVLMLCGVAAALGLVGEGVLGSWSGAAAVAVCSAALAFTYDRAAILIAVPMVALFAARVPRSRRPLLAAAAGLAALALVMLSIAPPAPGAVGRQLNHGLLGSRSQVWSEAWHGFSERPVTGYGPGRYSLIAPGATDATRTLRAHDLVLEEAVEAGAVAGLAALLLVICGGWRLCQGLRGRDPVKLAYTAAGLIIIISGIYDFTWSYAPIALLGVLSLGVVGGPQPVRQLARSSSTYVADRRHRRPSPSSS